MVVSTVSGWVEGSSDIFGDPWSGGFETVGSASGGTVGSAPGGVLGTRLGGRDGGFFGGYRDDVEMNDGASGGIFDVVRDTIGPTTDALPPDLMDIDARLAGGGTLLGGDLDPLDDGGGFLDDLRTVLGGGGGLGSVLGEAGPDDSMSGPFGGLDDVFDPPTYEVTPNVVEDDSGGDELPVIAAPDVDDDLDLDLGSVVSPGIVDSPVDDDGGILDIDLDVDLGGGSGPVEWGDDGGVSDDLGVDDIFGHRIDSGGDVDYGGDDFGMMNDGDPGIGVSTDDLDFDLGGGMELPEIEVPEPTDFEQGIQAADSVESSLDDLFGDLG